MTDHSYLMFEYAILQFVSAVCFVAHKHVEHMLHSMRGSHRLSFQTTLEMIYLDHCSVV